MWVLFFGPYLSAAIAACCCPPKGGGGANRSPSWLRVGMEQSIWNWVLWLSCFTELAFQVPHNLAAPVLDMARGSIAEWPFYAYGLSDGRWTDYNAGGNGLHREVWMLNINDACFGALVLVAVILKRRAHSGVGASRRWKVLTSVMMVVAVVWRDATLWRETVDYMWGHHSAGYPHTTANAELRPHAIACIWLVNGLWLIAPLFSCLWAVVRLADMVGGGSAAADGNKKDN